MPAGKLTPAPAGVWSSLREFAVQPVRHAWLQLALAFMAVGIPAAIYTLHHFYVDGAATDSWWQAWLVWRNGLHLDTPTSIAFGRSFFSVHLSPILVVPTLLSHFIPLGMFEWFALFVAVCFGMLGAAVFFVLRSGLGANDRVGTLVALIIAVAYGLGGFGLAALQLPHYEILFVSFAALFLEALARDDRKAAWLWFGLALSVREDAGLHLSLVLLVAHFFYRKPAVWPFVLASLAYSGIAFAAKHVFWPPIPSEAQITSVFSGIPPYGHLTWKLMRERLSTIFWWRGYVWQMAIVCAVWALWARDKLIVAGVVAAMPWALWCVTAAYPAAGTLDQYYSFPLLLGMIWPAIANRWRHGDAAPNWRRQALVGMVALAAAGAIGWRDGLFCYPCSETLRVGASPVQPTQVREFGTRLRAGVAELGRTRVDMAVRALWPDSGERVGWLNSYALDDTDTVIWFEGSLQDRLAWAGAFNGRLNNHYRVFGTNIAIATNRPLDASLFAPQLQRVNLVWQRMRATAISELGREGFFVRRSAPPGLIAYGPHSWMSYGINSQHGVALPVGRYQARFEFRAAQVSGVSVPIVRIEAGFYGGGTVATQEVRAGTAATAQETLAATLSFAVSQAESDLPLQLRAMHLGNADVLLRNVTLARMN